MAQTQLTRNVAAALAHRQAMMAPLESLAAELPWVNRHEIDALIRMLREDHPPEVWMQHPKAASWLPVVVGGAQAGDISPRIASLLRHAEEDARLESKRWSAISYPLIVLVLALLVFVGLSVWIVPAFAEMYQPFGILLPPPTEVVIWASQQLTVFLPRTMVVIATFVALILLGRMWLAGRVSFSRWPRGRLEGGNKNLRAMARLTGSVADLLTIGASWPEALSLSARGCQHPFLSRAFDELASAATDGRHRVQRSDAARWIPANVIDAFAQPDCPTVVPTLHSLSQMYSDRADSRVDWTQGLLGDIAIIAVGAVVGFVVIALFMPLIILIGGLS